MDTPLSSECGSCRLAPSVFLQIGGDDTHRLDITGGYKKDQLDDLLDVIDEADAWGTTVTCKAVIVGVDGTALAESATTTLACPVEPYDGALTFDAIASASPSALTYPGNGHGRVFKPRRNGKYYFENAGKLETDNKMRGFDCTSSRMSMFQEFPNMSGLYATALAVALGAEKCNMEMKKETEYPRLFRRRDARRQGSLLHVERRPRPAREGRVGPRVHVWRLQEDGSLQAIVLVGATGPLVDSQVA